jgi:hypothetical protein
MMRGMSLAALAILVLSLSISNASADTPAAYVWPGAELSGVALPSGADGSGPAASGDFGVEDGGGILYLSKDGELRQPPSGKPLPSRSPLKLDAFASGSGVLIGVRGNVLGVIGPGGFSERIVLPGPGYRVATGAGGRIYAFGPARGGSSVLLIENGRAIELIHLPGEAVSDLSVIGERIFFCAGNRIYVAARGEKPALLFMAAGEKVLRSVAPDMRSGVLFFSGDDAVYALRGSSSVSVVKGASGRLRSTARGLFILDAGASRLLLVSGLDRVFAPQEGIAPPDTPTESMK